MSQLIEDVDLYSPRILAGLSFEPYRGVVPSDNFQLLASHPSVLVLDPEGDKNVILPSASAYVGLSFTIINIADAAEVITLKTIAGAIVAAITQGGQAKLWNDGFDWFVDLSATYSPGFTPFNPTFPASSNPTPFYYFHGFAGDQIVGDAAFYDISGNRNHGNFGANLSNADAWANAGYVSTVNPAGGGTDSVIRLPGLNFDYVGGEKLILWWLGKCTAEGSATAMMGDGFSNTRNGIRFRMNADGTVQLAIGDTTNGQIFSGNSPAAVGDGNLHSMAWVLIGDDGTSNAKKYQAWVDEAMSASLTPAYITYSSGNTRDTKNANTWNIGTSDPAAAATTEGLVVQTRALVMCRLGRADPIPDVNAMTDIFRALRNNPYRRILENVI